MYCRRSAVDDDRSRKMRLAVDDDRRQGRWAVDDARSRIAFYQAQSKKSLDQVDRNLDRIRETLRSIRRMRMSSATIPRHSSSSIPSSASRKRHSSRHTPTVADDYAPLEFPLKWRDPLREYPPLELPLRWRNPPPPQITSPRNDPIDSNQIETSLEVGYAPSPQDDNPVSDLPPLALDGPTADQVPAPPAVDSPTRRVRGFARRFPEQTPATKHRTQPSSPASEHSNTARLDLPATGTPAGELPTSVDILQSEPQPENLQRDSGKESENSVDILPGDSTCLFRSQPLAASRRDASLSDREADVVLPAPYTSDSTLKTDDLSPARKNQAYKPPACPQVCVAPSRMAIHYIIEDVLNATGQVVEKTSYGIVYKAKLANGGNIALRLLREGTCKDLASSSPVIRQLGRARHENLVPLRAFYHGKRGEKLLIYDYITATSTSSPPQTGSLPPPRYSSSANYKNILTHLKFYENGGKSWLDPPLICVEIPGSNSAEKIDPTSCSQTARCNDFGKLGIDILFPHGHFANVLGYPDTGGPIVCSLDQFRALENELLFRIKQQEQQKLDIIVTKLLPVAIGTPCGHHLERVICTEQTECSQILLVPVQTENGTIRKWISHFKLWPYLETYAEDVTNELAKGLQARLLAMEQLRVQQLEWISASIVTMLTLWDGARNLRAESDIKYDLASNCHAFICVDLLAKKSVQRGQKPFPRRGSASQTALEDQILNETRLRNLQLQLLKDLWICARLTWSIAEHFDIEGMNPPLVDDIEDPLNILISNMHKILFSTDAINSNRLQDVQVVQLYIQRLGSRNARAGQLLISTYGGMRNCGRSKLFSHLRNELADMHRRRKIFDPGGFIMMSLFR